MSQAEKDANTEKRYKLTATEYRLIRKSLLEQAIKEVSDAGGGLPDLVWIIDAVVADVIHRFCDSSQCLDALNWEHQVQRIILRDLLGMPREEPNANEAAEADPQPTKSEVGRA